MAEKPVCSTRAQYRAGKKETVVKVYSVTKECRYLVIKNVPQLGLTAELLKLVALYGQIEEWRHLDEEQDLPEYTEAYWIKFKQIGDARFAKRKLDDQEFYHHLLDVSYSLQDEDENDVEYKLEERRRAVMNKVTGKKKKIIEGDYNEDEIPPWQVLDTTEFPEMKPQSDSPVTNTNTNTNTNTKTNTPSQPKIQNRDTNFPSSSSYKPTTTLSKKSSETQGTASFNSSIQSIRSKLRKLDTPKYA